MTSLLAGAFLAGLMGSPHCIGMCGGFAAAASEGPVRGAAYHGGRLVTYSLLGAAGGVVGGALPGPDWVAPAIAAGLMGYFALRLAGLVPAPHWMPERLVSAAAALLRRGGWLASAGLGLLTALIPCGLVYAALGLAVAGGSAAAGAAAMATFGLGTIPLLAAVTGGLRTVMARGIWTRRALAALVFAAGIWSLQSRGVTGETQESCPHHTHP